MEHADSKLRDCDLVTLRVGNLRAVQILLGHTRIESTVRYLGVDVEDALALSEAVAI